MAKFIFNRCQRSYVQWTYIISELRQSNFSKNGVNQTEEGRLFKMGDMNILRSGSLSELNLDEMRWEEMSAA